MPSDWYRQGFAAALQVEPGDIYHLNRNTQDWYTSRPELKLRAEAAHGGPAVYESSVV